MRDQDRNREVYAEKGGIDFSDNSWNGFSPTVLFFEEVKRRELVKSLHLSGILYADMRKIRILEIGCGWGHTLRMFVDLGALPGNCFGVDLNKHFIEKAREINPGMHFNTADASALEFDTRSFDIVCQFYALSSILDQNVRKKITAEMIRVIKKDGFIIWEDAASRRDVFYYKKEGRKILRYQGIPKCEIQSLFPGTMLKTRKTSLSNLISYGLRGTGGYSWCIAEMFNAFPVFRRSLHCIIRIL